MIALTGVGCDFHLPEQRIHFRAVQTPPRADGAVAGERAAHIAEFILEGQRFVDR